jgi:ABC-type multidrug transport system permease subunit
MTPRRSLLVGMIFVVIAAFYGGVQAYAGWPVDWAGITMLLALGLAMSIMTFVLFAGLRQS